MVIAVEKSPAEQVVPATRGVEITASATPFAPCRGFHANATETITVIFKDGGTTEVDLNVVDGATYAYELKAYTTGTGTHVALY